MVGQGWGQVPDCLCRATGLDVDLQPRPAFGIRSPDFGESWVCQLVSFTLLFAPSPLSSFWLHSPRTGNIDGGEEYLLEESLTQRKWLVWYHVVGTAQVLKAVRSGLESLCHQSYLTMPTTSNHHISHLHHSMNEPIQSFPESNIPGGRKNIGSALEESIFQILEL